MKRVRLPAACIIGFCFWFRPVSTAGFGFMRIGLFTRLCVLITVVLLFWFHGYGTITLEGGGMLLALIGFLLAISPCHRALSVDNLLKRLRLAKTTKKQQPPEERTMLNHSFSSPIIVLFDGRCGFCARTIIILQSCDWLHRLAFVNFHDPDIRKKYAPSISLEALNKAIHVRLHDGSHQKGFFAFRVLCKHLPPLWIIAPLLYIPGVSIIGSKAYAYIADHR